MKGAVPLTFVRMNEKEILTGEIACVGGFNPLFSQE